MFARRSVLRAAAGALAAPSLVEKVGAQTPFDWKQFKGQRIEVNLPKMPRSDILQARQKEFEELTGIRVGSEQIPEQQQRPKVAMEMASGRPSFDVVYLALHVQKRLIEKGGWMEDLNPLVTNPQMTAPDFDFADFGSAGLKVATGADGRLNVLPINQEQFILFWNKALFAQAGLEPPRTLDAMIAAARKLTNPAQGTYGFVGRGLKNANVVLYNSFLLGWDQETVTKDGRTALTDTPAAIEAGKYYQALMRETAPPGVIGFNWNESQTTFGQGRAALWLDSIGLASPLLDPTKSKVADKVGFLPVPAGPKGAWSSTFMEGVGIPVGAKSKGAAWLYCQWATGKDMVSAMFRRGAGTPARVSPYRGASIRTGSSFPADWFDTTIESLRIARSGLPEIVGVTEFRDKLGIALSNIIGGADVEKELKGATAALQPLLARETAG